MEQFIRSLQRRIIIIVALSALTGGAGAVWRAHKSHQNAAMEALYRKAFWGDETSLNELKEFRGGYADVLLKDLLLNDQSLADRSIVAVALDRRHDLPDAQLAAMLDITKSSRSLRHSAFIVFQKRGCKDECVKGSLRELNQIWSGLPTVEEERLRGFVSHPSILKDPGNATEQEAVLMIQSNPCATLRLVDQYDPKFIARLRSEVLASTVCR